MKPSVSKDKWNKIYGPLFLTYQTLMVCVAIYNVFVTYGNTYDMKHVFISHDIKQLNFVNNTSKMIKKPPNLQTTRKLYLVVKIVTLTTH